MKTLRLFSCLQEHGMYPVLKKINLVYTLSSHFFNIYFNICFHLMLIYTKLSFIVRLCRKAKRASICRATPRWVSIYQVILTNPQEYQRDLPLPGTRNGRTTQEWRVFPLTLCCLVHATSWETLKNIFTNICRHSLRTDNSEWHLMCRATYFHAKLSIIRRSLLVVAKIFAIQFYIELNNILFPARIFRKS
jgi:hypothetical protein